MGAACTTSSVAINGSVTSFNDDTNVFKIMITGPSQSGKSYLLSHWLYGFETDELKESQDFNMKKVTSRTGQVFTVWDISAVPTMTSIRRNIFYGTQGLVYVVRNVEESEMYWRHIEADITTLLSESDLNNIPLLIVINKSTDGITVDEVKANINVPNDLNRKWRYMEINFENTEEIEDVLLSLESLLKSNEG